MITLFNEYTGEATHLSYMRKAVIWVSSEESSYPATKGKNACCIYGGECYRWFTVDYDMWDKDTDGYRKRMAREMKSKTQRAYYRYKSKQKHHDSK